MMHVDKNADGHVLDQNVDRISKEIAYVPLSGRIKFKCSSCMLPRGPLKLNLDVLPRGPLKLNFGRASRGPMVWKVLFIPMCVGLLP